MTAREQAIRDAAARVHAKGVKPTSRNVLVELTGKPVSRFSQGMGGRDVAFFRSAMVSLGYAQAPKTGRWYFSSPPGLDEVLCAEIYCSAIDHTLKDRHTMADHVIS